jgi:hypothetical protein
MLRAVLLAKSGKVRVISAESVHAESCQNSGMRVVPQISGKPECSLSR